MHALSDFETVAREAAESAGQVLSRRFRQGTLEVEVKGLHDFVTEVDRQAEAAVIERILGSFPDHKIMSEEGSPTERSAPYRWIVDPLDGTTNFIHGVPTFAVSIALEDPDGLAAAAIHDPVHGETFHAFRGGGARLNGQPIQCSGLERPERGLIATGFPFREFARLDRYLTAFEACIRTTAGIRRAGSAAIDLAFTAAGRYDGFWEIGLSRWDIAAGILLVREAGGRVTDVVGADRALESGDIVAAGPNLHSSLLSITREAFAD